MTAGAASSMAAGDQHYVIDRSLQLGYVGSRTVDTFLPFLVPHLRPGVDVLDVGCGAGSIALDVAARIAPGRVCGVDLDPTQIDVARHAAARAGRHTTLFDVGSVYELPFEDATFDVVYANAVLQHVRHPERALGEMRRVLRPGGVAAVSDDDVDTAVLTPELPGLDRVPDLFGRAVVHAGGNPRYSRHLRRLLLDAGFTRTQGVATAAEVYGTEERTRWFADVMTGILTAPAMAAVIHQQGWASADELGAVVAALRDWSTRPDAYAAWLYCGALGWVD